MNSTPLGHALVHVFATQNASTTTIGNKVDGQYDVANVFGGGNKADYVPAEADTKQSTEVIIEGCDLTSIENVFGGGNAAATPATDVLVRGTKIINTLFGGGNGTEQAANVGYRTGGTTLTPYQYGSGKAVTKLMAGIKAIFVVVPR